jgi:hypothetical protein
MRGIQTSLSVAAVLAMAAGAAAQCETEVTKFQANDSNEGDQGGSAVSIEGDLAMTGSPQDDGAGDQSGAAHIFVRQPWGIWNQIAKLTSKYQLEFELAGTTVELRGGTAFLGSPHAATGNDLHTGAIYVFGRFGDDWIEFDRLRPADRKENDQFGSAIAADGAWMIASSPNHTVNGETNAGAVYFYKGNEFVGWELKTKQFDLNSQQSDRFGKSVAIMGQIAVAGAPGGNDGNIYDCGEVHAMHWSEAQQTWVRKLALLAPDRAGGDALGTSVAIWGSTLVAGAPLDDAGNLVDAGSVHVFVYDGAQWTWKQKLSHGNGFAGEKFGQTVAIAQGTIYVGSANGGGDIQMFQSVGGVWAPAGEVADPDQPWAGKFGAALASDGSRVMIGDPGDDYTILDLADTGAAYVVDVPVACRADVDGNGILDLFDFLGFQNLFVAGDERADTDCNGVYDLFDFLGYQNLFAAGCD